MLGQAQIGGATDRQAVSVRVRQTGQGGAKIGRGLCGSTVRPQGGGDSGARYRPVAEAEKSQEPLPAQAQLHGLAGGHHGEVAQQLDLDTERGL